MAANQNPADDQSSPKRARTSSRNGEQNVDRLSALPDGIICHILSFLPTQRSAQTSILAKRWVFLWAHVPVLDFECEYGRLGYPRFPGIVNTILLRHKAQILNTFRLIYNGNDVPCYYELETGIAVAVERNVQILYLSLRVDLPRCLLNCKTLIDLTLVNGVTIPPTAPISLSNLKKLHLCFLKCEVNFTRLLSGCPVLEELSIESIECSDPKGCYISSPTLKRLSVYFLLDRSMLNNPDYMVTINTPALRYLKVTDCSCKRFSISPCTSLVEANLNFYSLCETDDFYNPRVLKLLDSICNVKCLSISGSCDKICGGLMSGSIAKFGNLTELDLAGPWCLLSKLLETPHHLQVLTIFETERHSKHWMDPVEERSACRLRSLRTVRIDGFKCNEQDFDLVRYILRNAQVLERMKINCPGVDLKERFEAIRRISIFCRESKKCELHFS